MNITAAQAPDSAPKDLTRLLVMAVGLLTTIGFIWSNSGEQLLAYLLILFAAILPFVFWIRTGASGVPVVPVVSLAYIPYFGWPILSSSEIPFTYTDWEIVRAALTVVLFLVISTVSWMLIVRNSGSRVSTALVSFDNERVIRLVMTGLFVGIGFAAAAMANLLDWLGPFYGMARAIVGTLATVACFLSGAMRAQGILRGNAWLAAVVGLVLLVLISWSSLFLVGGIVYSLAMLFGYGIVARRIPWLIVGTVFAIVTILHAGKPELRAKYWEAIYGEFTVTNVPELMAEWFWEGLNAVTSGAEYQSPLERTGLMHMLLLAQSETPDNVDYLRGATYELLPSILMPRFIDASKPISGAGMELINIHYGIFSEQVESYTSIGWGLVAEAYANYGYPCVAGLAAILGFLLGALHRWSVGAAIISMPTLLSIAVMMAFINVELDFIQICSIILQSFAAVLIFHAGFRTLAASPNSPGRSRGQIA